MMRGHNIVCFAKEWTEDPTSNNHVMRLLARDNTVLWLNSISTRVPSLGHGGDVAKIGRKLGSLGRGAQELFPGLHVFTPLVLPFPHSGTAAALNRLILRSSVAGLRRRLRMPRFQLWSFLPTAEPYVGHLGEELSVYYCIDEWSQFRNVDRQAIALQEERLLGKVDVVFASSQTLLDRKQRFNPEVHLVTHGVDHDHFSSALEEETPLAPELAAARQPVIGFFGLIEDWIDTDLIAHVAKRRPDWTVCLIGRAVSDVSKLQTLSNVLLLGRRPYAMLPRYCKGFDVGLCPFRINELTLHVNPIKLREYLAAGLPVVSTDLPECRLHPEWTRIGREPDEFVREIEAALKDGSPGARRKRSDAMRAETWDAKIEQVGRVLLEKLAGRGQPRPGA
jgi:glycosyltransferase involved in cell wall biosynthesis